MEKDGLTASRPCLFGLALNSPNELRTDLSNAWITRIRDIAEATAADVPARIEELRMVKYVEKFTPKLKRHCLRYRYLLRYPQVGVVDSRAMEESPVRCTETSAIGTSQKSRIR